MISMFNNIGKVDVLINFSRAIITVLFDILAVFCSCGGDASSYG